MSIHAHLMGGLGNQLFQLFAAASAALDQKKQLQCHFVSTGTPRKCYNGIVYTCLDKPKDKSFVRFAEQEFVYCPVPDKPSHVETFGYFQQTKYFAHNQFKVKELLHIKRPEKPVLPGTVIHIRRSDFKKSPCHELLSMDYQVSQLQDMPRPQTLITDDPTDPFVHEFLHKTQSQLYMSASEYPEVDEFWTLQNHDFIVMSNSTFAWWAARFALDRNPNVVVKECPKFVKDPRSKIALRF